MISYREFFRRIPKKNGIIVCRVVKPCRPFPSHRILQDPIPSSASQNYLWKRSCDLEDIDRVVSAHGIPKSDPVHYITPNVYSITFPHSGASIPSSTSRIQEFQERKTQKAQPCDKIMKHLIISIASQERVSVLQILLQRHFGYRCSH